MTTPETPEPAEAPAEAGQSTRIIPARSDHPPTEAPAPAAPLPPREAYAWIYEKLDGAGLDALDLDVLIATASSSRVHGGAAGEALEAARAELIAEVEGCVTTYLADQDGHASCDGCLGALDHLVAAARAPGPVGGEADRARLLAALKGIEAEADRWLHDEAPAHEVIVNIGKHAAALLAELETPAAPAPVEPGGD